MGGQETLLLVGQHPTLLAGAVAFDSVTDFFRRYRDFAVLGRKGVALQALARHGGRGYAEDESLGIPAAQSAALARRDRRFLGFPCKCGGAMRTKSCDQSRRTSPGGSSLTCATRQPRGRLEKVTGSWSHTAESYRRLQLPGAIRWLGIVPDV